MIPRELNLISGVFVSPMLVVFALAFAAAMITAAVLNRLRLSQHVVNPPLVLVAITAIYTVLFGTYLIPV